MAARRTKVGPAIGVVHTRAMSVGVTPFLWFHYNLEEALAFYASVFGDLGAELRRVSTAPDAPVFSATFTLAGQRLVGLNGGPMFTFNEAVSLVVACDTQAELDRHWERLSDGGAPGRCGWLKDRFGLSWQVVPRALDALLYTGDAEARSRVMSAMLGMHKFDLAALEAAARGAPSGR